MLRGKNFCGGKLSGLIRLFDLTAISKKKIIFGSMVRELLFRPDEMKVLMPMLTEWNINLVKLFFQR